MKTFKIHTPDTTSKEAGSLLTAVDNMIGFIPNVFGIIAESSPALHTFLELNNQFSKTGLTTVEREIIQTAVSVENQCAYCVAGHTAFAEMQNISTDVIEAVRNNQPIEDTKLEALNRFTRVLASSQGAIDAQVLEDFIAAGYTHAHVLEVIIGVCVKTFSNLTSNTIGIPLDEKFSPYEWQPIKTNKAA